MAQAGMCSTVICETCCGRVGIPAGIDHCGVPWSPVLGTDPVGLTALSVVGWGSLKPSEFVGAGARPVKGRIPG